MCVKAPHSTPAPRCRTKPLRMACAVGQRFCIPLAPSHFPQLSARAHAAACLRPPYLLQVALDAPTCSAIRKMEMRPTDGGSGPLVLSPATMNDGSPDRQAPGAAIDSPSPFKFPNKSAVEKQGVIKLRSQGRRAASAVKAEDAPPSDRTPYRKDPGSEQPPSARCRKRTISENSRPDSHASPSAVLSEMPSLPLPAESRPRITIKKLAVAKLEQAPLTNSDTDSDNPDHVAKAASVITPRRVSTSSSAAPFRRAKGADTPLRPTHFALLVFVPKQTWSALLSCLLLL